MRANEEVAEERSSAWVVDVNDYEFPTRAKYSEHFADRFLSIGVCGDGHGIDDGIEGIVRVGERFNVCLG